MKKLRNINKYLLLLLALLMVVLSSEAVIRVFYPLKYKDIVILNSRKYDLDPNLIFALIKVESGFDKDAVSVKNARGLMQIIDRTGHWGAEVLGIENFSNESLFEPEVNISIGCWYISVLLKEFGGDLELALAAYNAGSGNVTRWLADRSLSSDGKTLNKVPFKETSNFLKKVKKYKKVYDNIYGNEY